MEICCSALRLGSLIDTYVAAQRAGVVETVLAQAREKHEEAHVLWQYWTAKNSNGLHNPDLAGESLTASFAASKARVKEDLGCLSAILRFKPPLQKRPLSPTPSAAPSGPSAVFRIRLNFPGLRN